MTHTITPKKLQQVLDGELYVLLESKLEAIGVNKTQYRVVFKDDLDVRWLVNYIKIGDEPLNKIKVVAKDSYQVQYIF